MVEFQQRGVDSSMFTLSELGDENRFLTARRSPDGNSPYELDMRERAATPRGKKRQQWVKDTSASNRFSNGGLFAIRLQGTEYYLSLPNPQGDFNMLELKPVRVKPIELVCESLQWEETEGGVIKKPAAIGRRINFN